MLHVHVGELLDVLSEDIAAVTVYVIICEWHEINSELIFF